MAAMLAASLSVAHADIIPIAAWNFENNTIAYAPSPTPSTALTAATASALGMGIYPTPAVGTNDPDVLQGEIGRASCRERVCMLV